MILAQQDHEWHEDAPDTLKDAHQPYARLPVGRPAEAERTQPPLGPPQLLPQFHPSSRPWKAPRSHLVSPDVHAPQASSSPPSLPAPSTCTSPHPTMWPASPTSRPSVCRLHSCYPVSDQRLHLLTTPHSHCRLPSEPFIKPGLTPYLVLTRAGYGPWCICSPLPSSALP